MYSLDFLLAIIRTNKLLRRSVYINLGSVRASTSKPKMFEKVETDVP